MIASKSFETCGTLHFLSIEVRSKIINVSTVTKLIRCATQSWIKSPTLPFGMTRIPKPNFHYGTQWHTINVPYLAIVNKFRSSQLIRLNSDFLLKNKNVHTSKEDSLFESGGERRGGIPSHIFKYQHLLMYIYSISHWKQMENAMTE